MQPNFRLNGDTQITKIRSLLSLALVSAATLSQAQFWHFSNAFVPTGASGNGGVMVGYTSGGYFYWTAPNGATVIGGDSSSNTGWPSISRDGLKIAGSYTGNSYPYSSIGRYDRSTSSWTWLGNLGFYSTGTNSAASAWGISGDGNTVVGQAYYNTTGTTGTRVNSVTATTSGVTNLHPTTSANGRISASNFDGTVVGGYSTTTAAGALWVNGVEQTITGLYNGNNVNFAPVTAISADGRFVAGGGVSAHGFLPYIYDRTLNTVTTIPSLWANERSVLTGISDDGQTAVGRFLVFGGNPYVQGHGFIWRSGVGTMLLNDVVDAAGINRAGLSLNNPFGISGDGLTIVGVATGVSATEAFMVRLGGGDVSGTVTLGEYDGVIDNETVEVQVFDATDTLVQSFPNIDLGPNGEYTFKSTMVGTYRIAVKGRTWLRSNQTGINITSAGVTGLNFSLTNGDVDGDNEVGIGDYAILSAAYNSLPGDGNWSVNADLDGDGEVAIGDYAILSSHYGSVGDN